MISNSPLCPEITRNVQNWPITITEDPYWMRPSHSFTPLLLLRNRISGGNQPLTADLLARTIECRRPRGQCQLMGQSKLNSLSTDTVSGDVSLSINKRLALKIAGGQRSFL